MAKKHREKRPPQPSKKPFSFSQYRGEILIAFALTAANLIIYWQCRSFEFVNFDDYDYVYKNLRVAAGLTFDNIIWAFSSLTFSNWHPLTWLSYFFDSQIFGLD